MVILKIGQGNSMENVTNQGLGNFSLNLTGYREAEDATLVGNVIGSVIRALSNHLDLSNLDGVTVSYDYESALLNLDRGIKTKTKLKPTSGAVVGVAMTPMVFRNDKVKSHIVLNASFIEGIILTDCLDESFQSALGIIAHECAHVSNCAAFDKSFPKRILSHTYSDRHELLRGECWLAVVDEYCATRLSASIGFDNLAMYAETFKTEASQFRQHIEKSKWDYSFHQDVDRVFNEAYSYISNLLKLAAYYLGDCAGKGLDCDINALLKSEPTEWLIPFIERLNDDCDHIFKNYGCWESLAEMEIISNILDDLAIKFGIMVRQRENGLWVDIF
jgi:hypothetical protein